MSEVIRSKNLPHLCVQRLRFALSYDIINASFVAGVINNEEGLIRAYVDGELKHEQNFDIGDTPGTPTEIWVGSTPEGYQWMNGTIDDVAFYNVALTEDDINGIMNNGVAAASGMTAVDPLSKLTTTWGKIKNVR